jgi:hypothetical protein
VRDAEQAVAGQQNPAMLLSTTGAALAGVGIGAVLGELLGDAAVAIALAGLLAHVIGMIGNRRAQRARGYSFSRAELAAYWLCWFLIAIVLAYVAADLIAGA